MSKRPGARAMLRAKRPGSEFVMVTVGEPDADCPHCVEAGLVPPPAPAQREDGGAGRRPAVRWSQPMLPRPQ